MLSFFLFAFFLLGTSERPGYRLFVSHVVDEFIANMTSRLSDPALATLFETCFPNALDTTIHFDESAEETFVVTGDINAQWLRDATNQVMPYVQFIPKDPKVAAMFRGLIKKQVEEILIDPYANAFSDKVHNKEHDGDETTRLEKGKPVPASSEKVFERKFELDSLASFLKLANEYHAAIDDMAPFGSAFVSAVRSVLDVMQLRFAMNHPAEYTFLRESKNPIDTLIKVRVNRKRRRVLKQESDFSRALVGSLEAALACLQLRFDQATTRLFSLSTFQLTHLSRWN
jgi:meiotically up-regulated gene 157 (Mug157) protein